jgi:uncharacterized protein YbjT (DUF2867 family)
VTFAIAKAAIIGATGATGPHLATALAEAGIGVRVVTRRAEALARLFPAAAVEKVAADALDAAALARAVAGCDLVVDCIGLPAGEMHNHAASARAASPLPRRARGRASSRCRASGPI